MNVLWPLTYAWRWVDDSIDCTTQSGIFSRGICRILDMKSTMTWVGKRDSWLHLLRSSLDSISPISFDLLTWAGRSPSNNGDGEIKSWDNICLRDMPLSFAMSMLLCASAISLDDGAFRSLRIAFDVNNDCLRWSVNLGSFLFEMLKLIFLAFSTILSCLYAR